MSEESGQGTGNQNDGGDGGNEYTPPEWANGLPDDQIAVIRDRLIESPGDAIAKLVETDGLLGEANGKVKDLEDAAKARSEEPNPLFDNLSEANRRAVDVKGWKAEDGAVDIERVLDSYRRLETAFGADKAGRTLLMPKDQTDTDAYDLIYATLGRPENPDGYVFEPPNGVPPNPELEKWFRENAHAEGLTAKQATSLYDKWNGKMGELMKAEKDEDAAAQEEDEEALRKEWGNAFDKKVRMAEAAAAKFGFDGMDDLADVKDSPAALRFMAAVGEALAEDPNKDRGDGDPTFELTRDEAREAYDQRKRDPDFMKALTDKQHPGHEGATKERKKYLDAIFGAAA